MEQLNLEQIESLGTMHKLPYKSFPMQGKLVRLAMFLWNQQLV